MPRRLQGRPSQQLLQRKMSQLPSTKRACGTTSHARPFVDEMPVIFRGWDLLPREMESEWASLHIPTDQVLYFKPSQARTILPEGRNLKIAIAGAGHKCHCM